MCPYTTLWNIDVQEIAMLKTCVKQAAMHDSATQNSCWKNSLQLFLRYLVHWLKDTQSGHSKIR